MSVGKSVDAGFVGGPCPKPKASVLAIGFEREITFGD